MTAYAPAPAGDRLPRTGPLPFSRLQSRAGTLAGGDYSIAGLENRGLFAVERKSIEDLVGVHLRHAWRAYSKYCASGGRSFCRAAWNAIQLAAERLA